MEAQQKPPNSLPLTRFLLMVQQSESSTVLDEITMKIFKAIFAEGDTQLFNSTASGDIEKLSSVIGDSLSKDKIKQYLDKSNSKEAKELAKTEAKKYVDEWNVYGVPWLSFKRSKDGQTKHFMGSDRFELIAAW